jgi:hypothetical protein
MGKLESRSIINSHSVRDPPVIMVNDSIDKIFRPWLLVLEWRHCERLGQAIGPSWHVDGFGKCRLSCGGCLGTIK